jgi:chromosome segregation ATPase
VIRTNGQNAVTCDSQFRSGGAQVKNLFDVIRDKENQLKELHNEIKRVEDQIEKLRAAASILTEDMEPATPMPVQSASPEPMSSTAAAGARGGKRWMP